MRSNSVNGLCGIVTQRVMIEYQKNKTLEINHLNFPIPIQENVQFFSSPKAIATANTHKQRRKKNFENRNNQTSGAIACHTNRLQLPSNLSCFCDPKQCSVSFSRRNQTQPLWESVR